MESTLRQGGRDPGLRLIETVLWNGTEAPRWPLHLDRLRQSARHLGWPLPDPPAPTHAGGPARLRLTMDRDASFAWQSGPLGATPVAWNLGLATERLDASDPWLGVKSTRRALHDRTRAALPPDLDELIFINLAGGVAEGTITNVFFDRGEGLRTPPLSEGALPGVLRRELACPEETLQLEELPHVRLWVGNALRGLIPARLRL